MNVTKEFWEKAYKENAPKMLGVCRRYVFDKEIAEDLMHEAFLTALNKSDSYSGKGCFEAWLRKIAVNTALMYLRHKNSKKIKADLAHGESDYQPLDEPLANNMRHVIEQAEFSDQELLEAIDTLPEHHKLVFNLYVIDNFTHAQIGLELHISPGTSKSHLARARKRLQQVLYQKALEKPREENQKKSAALFLFLSCRSNFVDPFVRGRLQGLSFEPRRMPHGIFDAVRWEGAALPVTKPFFLNTKISYWILGPSLGIILFTAIYKTTNVHKGPAAPVFDSMAKSRADTLLVPADSHRAKIIPGVVSLQADSGKNLIKNKPVVIKRTLVQRKTITIRDTIRIIDSAHAK